MSSITKFFSKEFLENLISLSSIVVPIITVIIGFILGKKKSNSETDKTNSEAKSIDNDTIIKRLEYYEKRMNALEERIATLEQENEKMLLEKEKLLKEKFHLEMKIEEFKKIVNSHCNEDCPILKTLKDKGLYE